MIKKNVVKNNKEANEYALNKDTAFQKDKRSIVRGIYFFLFICLCVLFFVKIATHRVSGVSMMPTLENKDYLFIIKGKKPSRYSLVTFAPKKHSADSYVKRILGLPGDRIWLDKNTVYLNHQMAQSNPTPENELQLSGSDLPDGTLKVRVTWEVASKLQGLEKIPEGQYFVLGDNRNHSNDSRHLGLIDQKQIEGVVSFRYYPLNRIGLID